MTDASSWTLGRMAQWATDYLKKTGSDSPRLDAQLLLAHVAGVDRVGIYVQFDRPLTPAELSAFKELIRRRATGEPVAYILGQKEFYRRVFLVDRRVLVPRPETELLVDAVLAWSKRTQITTPKIVDVGVGSGAISVTLAAELPGSVVVGVDLSPDALELARENAEKHGVRAAVKLVRGDALEPIRTAGSVDVVVSNPPYLDDALMATLSRDVADFEPALALHGGADGLDVLRRLVDDAPRVLCPGGLFAVEVAGSEQAAAVAARLRAGPWTEPVIHPDLSRHGRVVTAERHGPDGPIVRTPITPPDPEAPRDDE